MINSCMQLCSIHLSVLGGFSCVILVGYLGFFYTDNHSFLFLVCMLLTLCYALMYWIEFHDDFE